MFNELVESVAVRKATNKRWGFLASVVLQSASLVTLILLPLIYTQALPTAMLGTFLVAPVAPASVPPAPPAGIAPKGARQSVRLLQQDVLSEPRAIPLHAKIFAEPELPPETPIGAGATGGDTGGDLLHLLAGDSKGQFPAPPASANPPPAPAPRRVQQGGAIEAAKLIRRVQPAYPALALQTRIQGDVVLHAIIDVNGRVSELHVLSGHPLLVKAALDAVSQWMYQPTLLNEQPIEVDTTITVSFVLGM